MAINLADFVRTGTVIQPPKIVVYGTGGVGKTTFAAAAPRPIFLFAEEGQGMLDIPRIQLRDEDPVLRSWQEILDCLDALAEQDHDYSTVVLDTVDAAEPLLWKHTCAKHGKANIEAFGYGKGYQHAVDESVGLFDRLDRLRHGQHRMGVILLCHCEVKRYEAPDSEPFDRYKLRLQDKFADRVKNWSDALLFANYKTHVVRDKDGKREHARGTGLGERVLYTEERPPYWAKNRYGLPAEIPLAWSAFEAGMVKPQ